MTLTEVQGYIDSSVLTVKEVKQFLNARKDYLVSQLDNVSNNSEIDVYVRMKTEIENIKNIIQSVHA
jgi:hypothetical protein